VERPQSLELLNATHDFPCDFTIKVIGSEENDFLRRVVDAVQATPSISGQVPYQTRSTPNGKHVSITLEPRLESAEQVLLVYEQLKSVEGIVMTM
jgi:putative lipoic acid-binding regulatory protein